MKIKIMPYVIALASIGWASCEKAFLGAEPPASPVAVFQHIWSDFDRNYGLFAAKGLDWDSVFQVYRPLADDQMSKRELYDLTVSMLALLNDKHVTLYPASNPELPRWSVDLADGGVYVTEDFDFEVIKTRYIEQFHEPLPFIHYGLLAPEVGYLHIQHFDGKRKDFEKAVGAALKFFENAKGLVIDIRDNSGGFDPVAQYVAGHFAAQKKLYMSVRKKKGPGRDDFTPAQEWYVQPEGASQFTKPIIVLTTGATASAAETFLLAMRTQEHVTQLGTTTSGNFSDSPMWEAPNGWAYTISVGDYRAADGQSYEGIGLLPDIELRNQRADVLAGKDEALEKAVELLR
jgi:carboxyl-terminal processing protease